MSSKKNQQNSSKNVKGQAKSKQTAEQTVEQKINQTDFSQLKKDIRAVSVKDWDWSRVVYSEPVKADVPGGSGHYRRVRINYRYDDETIGPAIVELARHYCYGVQPDNLDKEGKVMIDKETKQPKQLRGYKVPVVMTSQSKGNPNAITPDEQAECDFFDELRAEVVRYSVENKVALGKGAKTDEQVDGLVAKILYRKENEDGTIVDGLSPKLYTNLIYYANDKNEQIKTVFYGPGDKIVNPLTMTNHFYISPNVSLDSIFISGKTISLQHKIYDASVEPIARLAKKRLARPNTMEANAELEYEETPETGGPNEMMQSDEE
jgi:hypothetical protein